MNGWDELGIMILAVVLLIVLVGVYIIVVLIRKNKAKDARLPAEEREKQEPVRTLTNGVIIMVVALLALAAFWFLRGMIFGW